MSPLAVMAIALPALGERPGVRRVVAALVGILGVGLLVLRAGGEISTLGLVAAAGSVVVSALGFVLVKKWPSPTDMLTTISWQLVAGGLVLVPVALLVEGAPPALSTTNLGGLLWLTTMGTAVAYYCWFRGLVRMPAGAVSIVGLINPVVGTGLGVLFAGELFGWAQALGMVLVLGGVVAGQRSLGSARGPSPSRVLRRGGRAGQLHAGGGRTVDRAALALALDRPAGA
jgi:probable blue pigment (indigoidine) exporter